MKKLLTIMMLCAVTFMGSMAQERQFKPFIEDGKTWRYYSSDSYTHLMRIFELKLEGTETINGREYAICKEYLDGVCLSDNIGPFGYFREESNGDLYYIGNAIGRIDRRDAEGLLTDETCKFPILSAEIAAELPEYLIYSFETKHNVFGGPVYSLVWSEYSDGIMYEQPTEWWEEEYETPDGTKLAAFYISNVGMPAYVIESIGIIRDNLVDAHLTDGMYRFYWPRLFEVIDGKGNILYYDMPYQQPQMEGRNYFIEKGKRWKYLSKNRQGDKEWEETVELVIGDWDYTVGCRYHCFLYRNGSAEPEQGRPWCFLWDTQGKLVVYWNENFEYNNPETHVNTERVRGAYIADLEFKNDSKTLTEDEPLDFAEVDYTGADGKKYLCYQNSEGTRLIEGVGFVFEDRPASLVGPIDDSAEQYTDRWYLYSVVDADGTEIYSDPRYRPGSGVFSVAADDAPTEYYNLQGVRVTNPTTGLYIVRQGEKAAVKFLK